MLELPLRACVSTKDGLLAIQIDNSLDQIELQMPRLHKGQRAVIEQMKRINFCFAGRRWGKTAIASVIVVTKAMNRGRCIFGAPVHEQAAYSWEELKKMCLSGVAFREAIPRRATFLGGGRAVYRSFDRPEQSRGGGYDLAVLEEMCDLQLKIWTEIIRPALMDRQGEMFAIGTPRGFNWAWSEGIKAEGRSNSMMWQIPTRGGVVIDEEHFKADDHVSESWSTVEHEGNTYGIPQGQQDGKLDTDKAMFVVKDNGTVLARKPHPLESTLIPWSEIIATFLDQPEAEFRQETLAEFIEWSNSCRFDQYVLNNMIKASENIEPREVQDWLEWSGPLIGREYVVGVDTAEGVDEGDFSCAMVGDVGSLQHVATLHEQVEIDVFARHLAELGKHYNNALLVIERNNHGHALIKSMTELGYPHIYQHMRWEGRDADKKQGFLSNVGTKPVIEAMLAERIRQRAMNTWDVQFLRECLSYVLKPTMKYAAVDGQHDDRVIAGMLMIYGTTVIPDSSFVQAQQPQVVKW